jgi:hypothetical protein
MTRDDDAERDPEFSRDFDIKKQENTVHLENSCTDCIGNGKDSPIWIQFTEDGATVWKDQKKRVPSWRSKYFPQ